MERKDPLDDSNGMPESDEELAALFRRLEPPMPSAGFLARTMQAVQREPLPAGRKPLRSPLISVIGWAAAIAIIAVPVWMIAASQAFWASGFSRLVTSGVGVGMWLVQFAGAGFAVLDVFTSTGLAVSKAVMTREGTTGLLLTVAMGAFALSALHRLLMSDGEGSSWQRLS
jgi:hypothetical protein